MTTDQTPSDQQQNDQAQNAQRPVTTQTSGEATGDLVLTKTPPPAVPAATVVLLRDSKEGLQVLMVKRTGGGAFGGFWVFPGGRVDDTDADELETAVREAKEEIGVDLDPSEFVRFSHWTPPEAELRRFSTWFFVAPSHVLEGQTVQIDNAEIVKHEWVTPANALGRRDAGEIELAPPTFVTLSRLAKSATVEQALAEARATEPEIFKVHLVKAAPKRAYTIFFGDVAYENEELLDAEGPHHRLSLTSRPWVYDRTI